MSLFFKPGFQAVYYVGTMLRFVRAKTWFYWNNSLKSLLYVSCSWFHENGSVSDPYFKLSLTF